ncbi:MAG TPA: hypothetical protein VFU63_03030, partial [Ktedonobacterales bacterium]|nr:hypothetical protein [Ktedonobacterales bacterium]
MSWQPKSRQSWRQIIGGVAAVVAAFMLVGGSVVGSTIAARAASATSHTAAMPLYGAPHETDKVTLPEWSIDGPALWTQGQP